jgi:hypothetical protein
MFAIHKPTGIKYYFPATLPSGAPDPAVKIPVRDLPRHTDHSAVLVTCDACSEKRPASLMFPTQSGPGLTCAACARQQQTQQPQPAADTHADALRKAKALLRLKAQREATIHDARQRAASIGAPENALVIVNQSLVIMEQRTQQAEAHARARLNLRTQSTSRARSHPSAREAGRTAGHSIGLARPSHQLKAGSPHLLR